MPRLSARTLSRLLAPLAALALLAACASGCGRQATPPSSPTLQSSLMDDQLLLYDSPARAIQTLRQIAALGVDEVKVSLVWSLVAPDPFNARHPAFNASDPAAYPPGAWTRYDRIVLEAHRLGLKVSFLIVPPAPDWAIPPSHWSQGERLGHAPDPTDLRQFVRAAGTRYSGVYRGLPRVTGWEIWNEPNFPAWLNPYYARLPGGRREYLQPLLYRELANAAWEGLLESGHGPATDTILVGESVSPGVLRGAQFDRGLYCVGADLKPLRGPAAAEFGCPASGSRAAFVRANPALFAATGFAYHPYSFNVAPDVPYPLRGWITMDNLDTLERLLNGALAAYGRPRRGGMPLYLTEFGYESNPPDPYVRNSTAQQASWLNEAEYMASRDPYVKLLNQFELVDSRPRQGPRPGTRAYWGTFQTGLRFLDGTPKPALAAFRLPIWVPTPRPGRRVTVWGQLRPADHARFKAGELEFRRRGANAFSPLEAVHTSNGEGFFLLQVAIPAAGAIRLAWRDPLSGRTDYSRVVFIG